MTRIVHLSLCTSLPLLCAACNHAAGSPQPASKRPISAIAKRLSWVGVAVEEPDYTIWGASPLQAGGKTHLYVARWPEANVDPAWRKSSEIAHYVADTPEGPFRFSDVALAGTGRETWDTFAPHNPEVRKVGDTYVLLYIGNDDFQQPPHPLNQRIGMATSASPYGPWQRVGEDGLILESSHDAGHWSFGSHVVNPAFLEVDGQFYLYFKAKCQGHEGMVYGLAVADRLEGPYTIADEPLTTKGVVIEDACVFRWGGKVCLLTTDNHGSVTGIRGGGALWVSDDGLHFDPAHTQAAYDRIPAYHPGYDPKNVTKIYGTDPKLERPKILMIDGKPAYLYAPSGWNVTGGSRTVCHVLRIDLEPGDGPLVGR
ncbi:MAG: hypothetical protein GY851_31595 [bacterium]|nr:hypothetical protein [bacterium]